MDERESAAERYRELADQQAAVARLGARALGIADLDALPDGGAIHLRARRDDGWVVIEVEDSGIGMSAEVQARAFEPFFSTKGERGTGLGLAQVYGIVQQHGGEIRVMSSPGHGTTFCLLLPWAEPAGTDPPAPAASPMEAGRLTILAVEDEPALSRLLASMLGEHDVLLAASGEEALAVLDAQPVDLVVSDLGLGSGMSGWDLADAVRLRSPKTRFILATGWGAGI